MIMVWGGEGKRNRREIDVVVVVVVVFDYHCQLKNKARSLY
jgi:hypothetical protein